MTIIAREHEAQRQYENYSFLLFGEERKSINKDEIEK